MNPPNSDQKVDHLPEPGAQKSGSKTGKSFFRDLLNRRVPQILGGYLAGSWILLEFLDSMIGKYQLSPHLYTFCLVTLAAMVPTVILLSWFHGRPGRDQWTRVEKIGIPANVIVAVVLLVILFNGRELGAINTTVNLTDEFGQEIERTVPKSEFRKKLAVFSLENETGDPDADWMTHAIPDMIRMDLMQDIYLDIQSVYQMFEDIRDEGFPDANGIPLIKKRRSQKTIIWVILLPGACNSCMISQPSC